MVSNNVTQGQDVISKQFNKLLDIILIQSQVLQSSMWNTMSPKGRSGSIQTQTENRTFTDYGSAATNADGHPLEQRQNRRETRRDQYVTRNEPRKIQQRPRPLCGTIYVDEISLNNVPPHCDRTAAPAPEASCYAHGPSSPTLRFPAPTMPGRN